MTTNADETVLITGGAHGIGAAMVREFAAAGYAVAFTYGSDGAGSDDAGSDHDAAEALIWTVRNNGGTARAWKSETGEFRRAAEVVREAQQTLGPIGVLVNNAGTDTNLTGTFYYTRATIGEMMQRGGSIVNIAGLRDGSPISGVIGFTKALAKEVAPFGVSVNAISPWKTGNTDSSVCVAKLALYLAGAQSQFVTGEVWNMDAAQA